MQPQTLSREDFSRKLRATLFRPHAIGDGAQVQFGWIKDDMFDLLAIPRVGDVNKAVARLDHSGV